MKAILFIMAIFIHCDDSLFDGKSTDILTSIPDSFDVS